jgi:hypothetical protein
MKFHVGEEQTFFRAGRPTEMYQLDHYLTDEQTYGTATRCDVVQLENRAALSDHAPLLLETNAAGVRAP